MPHQFANAVEVYSPLPDSVLNKVSEKTKECLQRLFAHRRVIPNIDDIPVRKLAAVLVLLYEKAGRLRVLLTTRSKSLRTHAGQTALPGGRCDESDKDIVGTAFREAFEEVGLPLGTPHIHVLGLLEPFLSLHGLVVTPVLAFLDKDSLLDDLVAADGEVAHIFDHPLEAMLDPELLVHEPLVEKGSENWPYPEDLHNTTDSVLENFGETHYRMHRFRSNASPVKGLTSDILIKTAEIAYARSTAYERYHPQQLFGYSAVSALVKRVP